MSSMLDQPRSGTGSLPAAGLAAFLVPPRRPARDRRGDAAKRGSSANGSAKRAKCVEVMGESPTASTVVREPAVQLLNTPEREPKGQAGQSPKSNEHFEVSLVVCSHRGYTITA